MQEYYELFPFTGSKRFPVYYYATLYNNDIQKRDFMVLQRISNEGLLTEDDADFLSKTNPLIVKGMLLECMDAEPKVRKASEKECNRLIKENLLHIVN